MNIQKKNSNTLLHKFTHQTFHSSTIKNMVGEGNALGGQYIHTAKNECYYNEGYENGSNSKKRNNSDNSKTILNNSFKNFEKNMGLHAKRGKILFNNIQKNNDNSYIINNSAINNNHKHKGLLQNINKKNTIHIKLNNGYENNSQTVNKSINFDLGIIRPVKTEYIITDFNEDKKGLLYDYNSSILSTDIKKHKDKIKEIKVKFSKSRDKKNKNIYEKENNIHKRYKENLVSNSSKQIPTETGKNLNEKKKRQKINI